MWQVLGAVAAVGMEYCVNGRKVTSDILGLECVEKRQVYGEKQ